MDQLNNQDGTRGVLFRLLCIMVLEKIQNKKCNNEVNDTNHSIGYQKSGNNSSHFFGLTNNLKGPREYSLYVKSVIENSQNSFDIDSGQEKGRE